jgi:hypothetical protein
MKIPIWLSMHKRLVMLCILTFLLTSCSSSMSEEPLNMGRINVDSIQKNFRTDILSKYERVEEVELIIPSSEKPKIDTSQPQEESQELQLWRDSITEPWKEIPDGKFFMVCDILYKGIMDYESQFAKYFQQVRNQFERDGVTVNSMVDIQLQQDNRSTIQFPTKDFSSPLFACSSRMTLKLSNGDITSPMVSTLTWNYYLDGAAIKYTISFTLRNS